MTRLKQLRVDALLSVDELAHRTGISARTIRNLEEGKVRHPRTTTLGPLATFFDVRPSTLLRPAVLDEHEGAAA